MTLLGCSIPAMDRESLLPASQKVAPCEPHETQQDQVQDATPESG